MNKLLGMYLPRLRFPTELAFEPIQLCNAKCFCCPYTFLQENDEYRGQRMSRDSIDDLLTQFGTLMQREGYSGRSVVIPFRYSDPLICRDLDLVFERAHDFGFKVKITTNAVSFHERNAALLDQHLTSLMHDIHISVIGSTKEEVQELMAIDLDRTISRLKGLRDKWPRVADKIVVSLRGVRGDDVEEANLQGLLRLFASMNLKANIKRDWRHNRIEGEHAKVTSERYVRSCKLYRNKLLRRIEVMVNGNVVLCCDDAEGRKIFGNVFSESIESVWNGSLADEHRLIYQRHYSNGKDKIICNSCSRANWVGRHDSAVASVRPVGKSQFVKQFAKGNISFV